MGSFGDLCNGSMSPFEGERNSSNLLSPANKLIFWDMV